MSDSSRPFFTIITPVYNGGEAYRACLEAFGRSTFKDWEMIVVDDGSTDGSDVRATEFGAKVLRTTGRVGPGAARNQGAKEARGEFVFFIDADCEVAPDTLERAAAALKADPGLDALFGSYDDTPAGKTLVSQYKNLQHHFVHQTGAPEATTFWSGCGAMRTTRFLELGGFDVELFPRPSIEDIELGYRLKAAGGRIRLDRDVQVKHHKVWTIPNLVKVDIFDRGIPWTLLTLERGDVVESDLNLEWKAKASVALACLVAACLVLAVFAPWLLWAAAGCGTLLLLLNADFYGFFLKKKGLFFTIASVPLHWFYFLYCAVAYVLGHWKHLTRKRAAPVDAT
ncbi:MAG: glycosyltransferase family 2 protein [Gemmatimonadetes bacterium]|nr:glycosyltransferase family 2 protein [Gemmatimonadota bacterium]